MNRKNGADEEAIVEAANEAEAIRRAGHLVIESVRELPDPYRAAARMQPVGAPAWAKPPAVYIWVQILGSVIFVAGGVTILTSLILIMMNLMPTYESRGGDSDAPVGIAAAVGSLIIGILQAGFGSLILMMRDVALYILRKK